MIPSILFYLFSGVLVAAALAMVGSRNPVHAVLFLVLAFFNAAGLFLLLGAEFLAFILMIVYVGAVAVLFLFVVMMLDIHVEELKRRFRPHFLIGAVVAVVLLVELGAAAWGWTMDANLRVSAASSAEAVENTRAIGRILYTDYFYPFQVSGLILLVAMIGAIVLSHRERKNRRSQNVAAQIDRPIAEILEIVKVESGKGVNL